MARIRTIKPEFWTDSKTGSLSGNATKLFIGMLNFADDYGVLESDIAALKAKIFPYEPGTPLKILAKPLSELFAKGLVILFKWDERAFYWIRNFEKHQKVDKPGKPLIDDFTSAKLLETLKNQKTDSGFDECSTNGSEDSSLARARGSVREGSVREGKGKEGNGKEKTKTCAPENSFPEKKEGPPAKGPSGNLKAFAEVKAAYPKKNSKFLEELETFRRFCLIPEGDWALVIQATKNYAESKRVKDGIGVKDPKNFIGEELPGRERPYWREWIEPEKKEEPQGASHGSNQGHSQATRTPAGGVRGNADKYANTANIFSEDSDGDPGGAIEESKSDP